MMQTWLNWLDMGGYAFYVWSAYGCFSGIFLMHILDIKKQRRMIRKKLQAWYRSNHFHD